LSRAGAPGAPPGRVPEAGPVVESAGDSSKRLLLKAGAEAA